MLVLATGIHSDRQCEGRGKEDEYRAICCWGRQQTDGALGTGLFSPGIATPDCGSRRSLWTWIEGMLVEVCAPGGGGGGGGGSSEAVIPMTLGRLHSHFKMAASS